MRRTLSKATINNPSTVNRKRCNNQLILHRYKILVGIHYRSYDCTLRISFMFKELRKNSTKKSAYMNYSQWFSDELWKKKTIVVALQFDGKFFRQIITLAVYIITGSCRDSRLLISHSKYTLSWIFGWYKTSRGSTFTKKKTTTRTTTQIASGMQTVSPSQWSVFYISSVNRSIGRSMALRALSISLLVMYSLIWKYLRVFHTGSSRI